MKTVCQRIEEANKKTGTTKTSTTDAGTPQDQLLSKAHDLLFVKKLDAVLTAEHAGHNLGDLVVYFSSAKLRDQFAGVINPKDEELVVLGKSQDDKIFGLHFKQVSNDTFDHVEERLDMSGFTKHTQIFLSNFKK